MISFTECVSVVTDSHFIAVCNKAAADKPLEHTVDGELLQDLVQSDNWLSYLWKRFQRILRPAHDGL